MINPLNETSSTPFASWEQAVQWLREQPSQHELIKAAYYDDPLREAADRYLNSDEWSAIHQLLPSGRGAALDVGAGRGIASYALAREGFQVTALEPDGSALIGAEAVRSLARECQLSIEVTQDFSERLPFHDAKFDLVFARAVLHHTSELRVACKEFFRVLKPGGKLIAVREHVISRPEDLDTFLAIHPLHRFYGGENAFELEVYETSIRGAGFKIEHVIGPLESALNFAPHTLKSLQQEVATRAFPKWLVARNFILFILGLPGCWSMTRFLLKRIDRRPGRLYSFVATRPH
jgi:SAM-dependent methyltransferase